MSGRQDPGRGPPPCAPNPVLSAPPDPVRPPRRRAGDRVPRLRAHVLPPRAPRVPGRSPLPRSGPGRPHGAGSGLGRGDAPPAAAATGSRSRSESGRGELLPGGGGRRCSRGRRRRRGAGVGATRPPISGRGCAGSSAPAGGRLLARQTLPHAEPAEKRRRLFLLPLPLPSPSSFPPLPQPAAGSLLAARRALAATQLGTSTLRADGQADPGPQLPSEGQIPRAPRPRRLRRDARDARRGPAWSGWGGGRVCVCVLKDELG